MKLFWYINAIIWAAATGLPRYKLQILKVKLSINMRWKLNKLKVAEWESMKRQEENSRGGQEYSRDGQE